MDHHRLGRGQRLGMSKAGAGGFNRTARVMLFEMRWRKPPRETGLHIAAWFCSITLHLLVAMAMLFQRPMVWEPPGGAGGSEDGAIQVRLIEPPGEATEPAPPPPVKLPPRVPREGRQVRAPRRGPVSIPSVPRALPPPQAPQLDVAVAPPRARIAAPRPQVRVATVAPSVAAAEPAPARPAPPRIVPEVSPMSVPPPTIKAPALTAVQPASTDLAPVPVERQAPRTEAPQLAVSVPKVEQPSPAPVTQRPVAPAPEPLAPVPLTPDRPDVQRPHAAPLPVPDVATPAPQVAQAQVPVAAPEPPPLPAPDLPAPRTEAPTAEPPAALPDAVEGPLSVPPVQVAVAAPQPAVVPAPAPQAPAQGAAAAPAAPRAAPVPKPASASWADTSASDRFHGAQAPSEQGGLKLYGKDGSLALTGGSGGEGTPAYIQRLPQGNSDVMSRRSSLIRYRATRFDQYWVPYGNSALDDALQRLVDKLTFTKKIELPNGIHARCTFTPVVVFFSCGANPPPVPIDTSNDKRLNMAPARPLVPGLDKPAPAPPASATMPHQDNVSCATARVAGSPPPPGCPGSGKAADQW